MSLTKTSFNEGDLVMIVELEAYHNRVGEIFKVKYNFTDFVIVHSTDDGFDIPLLKNKLGKVPSVLEVLHD